jgi:hypothetical protein
VPYHALPLEARRMHIVSSGRPETLLKSLQNGLEGKINPEQLTNLPVGEVVGELVSMFRFIHASHHW